MIRDEVLKILEQCQGKLVSGGELARQLDVSRTAIWKAIATLRERGFDIESVQGEGYRLSQSNDVLTASGIALYQTRKQRIGQEILVLPQTSSTNTEMKQTYIHQKEEGFILVAHHQTAGRGRLGRTFHSDSGTGIYFSVLLRPTIQLEQISFLTIAAAAATADAIEQTCGFSPEIKWVNDLYKDGKKLCGILTEASIEGESANIDSIILGIGINVTLDRSALSPEINQIAGCLADFSPALPLRNEILGAILSSLDRYYCMLLEGRMDEILASYRSRITFLGKQITVLRHGTSFPATALSIDEKGHLRIQKEDGSQETLFSGEISIRL